MVAFVNGQALDVEVLSSLAGGGPSHSSLAIPADTKSVTLVLKSFCSAPALPHPSEEEGTHPPAGQQPMVGGKFDVCGLDVTTDKTWRCMNHYPDSDGWISPFYDDSAWPTGEIYEGDGLPPGFNYIAGPSGNSNGVGGGGWECFCRTRITLPGGGNGEDGQEDEPPVIPVAPSAGLEQPFWTTNVVVEGNCSLGQANTEDLAVNFGTLLGLAQEDFETPTVHCALLEQLSEVDPPGLDVHCPEITDPCLLTFSFSGPQDWLNEDMINHALQDPTLPIIFDTRSSASSEFCHIHDTSINQPELDPAAPVDPVEPPVGALPLPPDDSQDNSVQEGNDPAPDAPAPPQEETQPGEEDNPVFEPFGNGAGEPPVEILPEPAAEPEPVPSPSPVPEPQGSEEPAEPVVPLEPQPGASEEPEAPLAPEPQPQPGAAEDPGAPDAPMPSGGDPAPAEAPEEPLAQPPQELLTLGCGEVASFALNNDEVKIYQVQARGNSREAAGGAGVDVTVRATTCVEGTMVDTIVSLYDQAPTMDGVTVLATNDDDATCTLDPTFSTTTTTVPEETIFFVRVANKAAYGGDVTLDMHCGVYNTKKNGGGGGGGGGNGK